MTTKTRRTEIQIETHELRVIRFRGKQYSAHCERCNALVSALSPHQAAAILRITPEDVFRRLSEEKFHLVETRRGLPLVCGNSLNDENKGAIHKSAKART